MARRQINKGGCATQWATPRGGRQMERKRVRGKGGMRLRWLGWARAFIGRPGSCLYRGCPCGRGCRPRPSRELPGWGVGSAAGVAVGSAIREHQPAPLSPHHPRVVTGSPAEAGALSHTPERPPAKGGVSGDLSFAPIADGWRWRMWRRRRRQRGGGWVRRGNMPLDRGGTSRRRGATTVGSAASVGQVSSIARDHPISPCQGAGNGATR